MESKILQKLSTMLGEHFDGTPLHPEEFIIEAVTSALSERSLFQGQAHPRKRPCEEFDCVMNAKESFADEDNVDAALECAEEDIAQNLC